MGPPSLNHIACESGNSEDCAPFLSPVRFMVNFVMTQPWTIVLNYLATLSLTSNVISLTSGVHLSVAKMENSS